MKKGTRPRLPAPPAAHGPVIAAAPRQEAPHPIAEVMPAPRPRFPLRRRLAAALSLGLLALQPAIAAADLAHRTLDAGGGPALGGTRYQNTATLGGITGPATTGSSTRYHARSGYPAELHEPASFAIAAPRTLLEETEKIQLRATLGLDDGSLLRLPPAEVTWQLSPPSSAATTGIGPTGLLDAGNVYQDTTIPLTATYAALADSLSFHIRDSGTDDFGLYAGDGIPDTWQIEWFGLENPDGLATADPTGTGQNNLFKYHAGLDPLDPADRFTLGIQPATVPPGGAASPYTLDFGPCYPGHSYRILTSNNLSDWSLLHEHHPTQSGPQTYTDPSPAAEKKFYKVEPKVGFPQIRKVAVMGDSITAQGSSNVTFLNANGYYAWARMFNQGGWELVQNGSRWCFATGGKRSDEVSLLHRAEVIASDADTCVISYGTNDAYQLRSTSAFIAQAISDWQALKTAGIKPIATTVLPMGSIGNSDPRRQARVAEYNVALREAASIHQVVLCDWSTLLEAAPGSHNGIALDSYFPTNDHLHPKPYPCSLLGRALASTISNNFDMPDDVWGNSLWITPNVQFSGINGQPSQWSAFAPAGGAIRDKKLIPSPDGNWWELTIEKGSSSSNFSINSFEANIGGTPSGKTLEATAELEVIEGSLNSVFLSISSNGTRAATMFGNIPEGPEVKPTDGIVLLRTLPTTLGANSATATPGLYFSSGEATTKLRIRRCGIRQMSP